ncbi:MAG: ATP-dependent RNA helicase HrpA [Kiritimatiellae bacterium]|nr:ATP-dependent RNA helicase HrpA [Kiritimatiellia bacterium]
MDGGEIELNYQEGLPICEHREEIIALMEKNPVVIVCGDTGSGKTTQLPKMAMELGRGKNGRRIACTQPRRLAAVTVAERVAEELKSPVGGIIGYQHRFARRMSEETRVKFMTDGVLLAETRSDPLLRAYDTIIVDEAHERSLNVDFLLGILKRILEKRRDLKVIVSSATLDTERFSQFFGGAPTLSIPGRLFPIEIQYREPPDGEEADLPREISAAIRTLPPRDDVLVFLPGERDIRETADYLQRSQFHRDDETIPLLASLPAAEQQRAFRPSQKRRVILATNVAETSVTIPGIRAVVDSGLARISRYVHRTQVQRLQIEPVSQASARQRAGRCGRLGPGTCIRLYSEKDFESREAYTPPEVLRSSLAGVILTMLDLRLGNIENFPFIDPPRPTMIREGLRELLELGAIRHDADHDIALTATGRKLARIPVEPRLARMLLAASQFATLPSALPIVAAMSCDDPRRRPVDEKEKADQAHAQFRVPGSDFLGTLKLWKWWDEKSKELSQTQLRKLAPKTYLSYQKMREWRDLVRQLTDLSKHLGLDIESDNGGPDALHRALLTGLLARIGHLDPETNDYRGAHALRFALHPSSVLGKRRSSARPPRQSGNKALGQSGNSPEWIVAGELVDTSRLFARNAAEIDVRWIEPLAGDIAKHSYRSPEWDAENGFVRATEQVTLYGLVIVPARRRDYSRIDPALSRQMFLLHALAMGEFPHPPPSVRENAALIGEIKKRAERLRRPELFDANALVRHFDEAIPREIVSTRDLVKWLRVATDEEKSRFRLDKRQWLPKVGVSSAAFPDSIRIGGVKLALSYRHTPDDPERDGITCTVRKSDAAVLKLWSADWLVPGALPEKLAFLLGVLPSSLRRVVSPISDTVAIIAPLLSPGEKPLVDAVREVLKTHNGIAIPSAAWENVKYPPHLLVRYRIKDEDGKILAETRDLDAALAAAGVGGRSASASSPHNDEKHADWDFGTIAEKQTDSSAGWTLTNYPALSDEGDGVRIKLFKSADDAARAHEAGVVRLFFLRLTRHTRPSFATNRLPLSAGLYLGTIGYERSRIADDLLWAAIRKGAVEGLAPIRSKEDFETRLMERRGAIDAAKAELSALFSSILESAAGCAERLETAAPAEDIYDAVETQLAWLVFPGFLKAVPPERLKHYDRYLRGVRVRIDRARSNPSGDRTKESRVAPYWEQYHEAILGTGPKIANRDALAEYRWMVEEFRVSVFAPEVRAAIPVSEKRLDAKWAEALGG